VNLYEFYSYKLIGKLTVFFQLLESSFRNIIVDVSTTDSRHSSTRFMKKRVVF
jgi:hypothetical protein